MFDIIAMRSDSLAAALSLQEDEYPVELSGTDSLVKDIVSRLDKVQFLKYSFSIFCIRVGVLSIPIVTAQDPHLRSP